MRSGGLQRAALSAAIVLTAAGVTSAGTTGQLVGRVSDEQGLPLPGVLVTAASPSQIGGDHLAHTDSEGNFRYPRLTPGEFTLRLELDGFATRELTGVQVRLDRTAQLLVTLSLGVVEDDLLVVEAAPVVDPVQVSLGQTFTSDYLAEAAVGRENRDLFDLAGQAAGVNSSSGIRVLGSAPDENAILIDGLETTNPLDGIAGVSRFSFFEAIDEAVIHTAGFQAEFGLATGGVINLVTKSGGNELHGTVDYRYSNPDLATSGDHFDPEEEPQRQSDLSGSFGGPLVEDRLWFFTTLQRLQIERTPSGSPTTFEREGLNYLAKLSWQAARRWSVAAKLLEDSVDGRRLDSSAFRAPEATSTARFDTRIGQIEALGQLSDRLLVSLRAGAVRSETPFGPDSGDLTTIGHFNLETGENYGNAPFQEYRESERDEAEADLTWFIEGRGSHEAKAGLRLGDRATSIDTCFNGHGRCRPQRESFLFRDILGADGGNVPLILEVWTGVGWQQVEGSTTSLYLQDTWRLGRRVTLRPGLRWDRAEMRNDLGHEVADLELLQPRLGIAWDLLADGRNLVRVSWGRFMHPSVLAVPLAVAERNGTSAFWGSCSFFEILQPGICTAGPHRTDPEGWDPAGWTLLDASRQEPNQTSPDLEPMHVDELVLGYERELFRRTAVEVGYVRKDSHDLIEDTCRGNEPQPSEGSACDYLVVTNLAAARRDYEAWLMRFESRAHDRVHVLASYVYSRSKGSVEGSGVGSLAFDVYPVGFENRYGYLPDHTLHTVKVNGWTRLPADITLALGGWWRSEFHWTPSERTPQGNRFLEPRGSRKGNALHNLDLQVMKGFDIGRARVRLIAAVYNLLDSERPTAVCTFATGCAGTNLGRPIDWQQPRRYELGVRVEM